MPSDDKKYISRVPLDPDVFDFLLHQANRRGIQVGEFAGIVIGYWQDQFEPDGDLSPSSQFYWNKVTSRRDKERRDSLWRMAAEYNEFPTETGADLLQTQCDILSVDYKSLMAEVGQDPFSSIVITSRDGTKFHECMQWLTRLFRTKSELYVSTIRQMGSRAGFKNSMIDRVRSAINEDRQTPELRSEKRGKLWVWRLIKADGTPHEIFIPEQEDDDDLVLVDANFNSADD